MGLLAARNGSVSMSSDTDKTILELLEETEKITLNKKAIRKIEITFLILVTIGILVVIRAMNL